jgi:hypothetical protein
MDVINPPDPVKGEHWEYRLIPAGAWRRMEYQEDKIEAGTANASFGSDEPRPHFVPLTELAEKQVAYNPIAGCPGQVLIDGTWKHAARFVQIGWADIQFFLEELDESTSRIKAAYEDAREERLELDVAREVQHHA